MIALRTLLAGSVATYGGLIAVPALRVVVGEPPGLGAYAGAFAGVFAVVFAGARSARDLAGSLAPWRSLLVLVPPVTAFAWFVHRAVDAGVVAWAYGVGAVAVLAGGVAFVVAHEVRLRERSERAREFASFEARSSPSNRKLAVGAYAALVGVVVLVGSVLVVVAGVDAVAGLVPALGGSAAALPAVTAEREVEVTDEGVRVGRTFHDWETFTGYAVTGEALVLCRPGWRRSFRFDVEDVEDLEATEDALRRYLPSESP